jgi:hypothetical protein
MLDELVLEYLLWNDATTTHLACQAENKKITQDEIGRVFGVTSVTIRNNAKKLNKFIKNNNLKAIRYLNGD